VLLQCGVLLGSWVLVRIVPSLLDIKAGSTSQAAQATECGTLDLGLKNGFEPPDLDSPGRLPHQQ